MNIINKIEIISDDNVVLYRGTPYEVAVLLFKNKDIKCLSFIMKDKNTIEIKLWVIKIFLSMVYDYIKFWKRKPKELEDITLILGKFEDEDLNLIKIEDKNNWIKFVLNKYKF